MGFDAIEINLVVVYWWFEPYIYLPLLHSGESVGGMVALNKKTVVSFCLLISKISLPVHNFGIKMLLTSLAGSATLGDTSSK